MHLRFQMRRLLVAVAVVGFLPMAAACGTTPYPASSPQSPAGSTISGLTDTSGSAALGLAGNSVHLSNDGGTKWYNIALPSGLPGKSVATVAVSPGRDVWVAAAHGVTEELFRHALSSTGSWAMTPLPASSASGVRLTQPPSRVLITPGAGTTVTVAEAWDQSFSNSLMQLFFSADNGTTFTLLPAPNPMRPYVGLRWWGVAFSSAENGVAVVGATENYLIHTSDGGKTWTRSALPGADQDIALGTPVLQNNKIFLPVYTATASTTSETFSILVSRNGGVSFSGLTPRAITIKSSTIPGPVPFALSGSSVWLAPPGGTLLHSTNDGGTWTTLISPARAVQEVTVVPGSNSATLISGGGVSCTGPKARSQCAATGSTIWRTANGGRNWVNVTPA
jgi:photosystem II stability/assembly factor-like uncharacterized protein